MTPGARGRPQNSTHAPRYPVILPPTLSMFTLCHETPRPKERTSAVLGLGSGWRHVLGMYTAPNKRMKIVKHIKQQFAKLSNGTVKMFGQG